MPALVLPSLILPILLGQSFAADASKAETVEQIAAAVHPSIAVLTVNARDGKGQASAPVSSSPPTALSPPIFTLSTKPGRHRGTGRRQKISRHASLCQRPLARPGAGSHRRQRPDAVEAGRLHEDEGRPSGRCGRQSARFGQRHDRRIVGAAAWSTAGRSSSSPCPSNPATAADPFSTWTAESGIVSSKSLVTPNLGFAVAVNRSNHCWKSRIPYRCRPGLPIGALDPEEWQTQPGARWRQHAGRIRSKAPARDSAASRCACGSSSTGAAL